MKFYNSAKQSLSVPPRTTENTRSQLLRHIVLTLGLILLIYDFSQAHDYWYETDGQDYVLYRGHHHTEHKGEKVVPYAPSIVQKGHCLSPEGTIQTFGQLSQYPARIPGPCRSLTVEVDSGYWSQTWTETLNQSKENVSDAVFSWRALENTKLLNSWTPVQSNRPLSHGLEILLEKNPFVLENGQKLRLLVMLEGKPLPGVTVAYDGNPRGVTGNDGRINVRIRHGGLQVLTGSIDEPPRDSQKADKLTRSAALFFELPEDR
ncbi:MAG: DUF4198 domain-containing protein [Nitrospirales bacterium]